MNLIKSTSTFSFFTLISRILGYFRDVLIAIYLGSGPIADAFFVAFRIPNTFRRLFAEGSFNAAFVPSYTSELTKGKISADFEHHTGEGIFFVSRLFDSITIRSNNLIFQHYPANRKWSLKRSKKHIDGS